MTYFSTEKNNSKTNKHFCVGKKPWEKMMHSILPWKNGPGTPKVPTQYAQRTWDEWEPAV